MPDTITEKEYKSRIDKVIDYIIKNLNSDISLQTLSEIANYSPFHFQRIFKQVISETPKQFVTKLRLKAALHLAIIHPQKTLNEIAIDSGFSSLAIFSRAIKNYFGMSPEHIRTLSSKERAQILEKIILHSLPINNKHGETINVQDFSIRIVRINTVCGVYMLAPFDDAQQIQDAFIALIKTLKTHDVPVDESKFYGILSPHQGNIYKALVAINASQPIPDKFNKIEIKSGKYAAFKVMGEKKETLAAAEYFYYKWLPDSGYKIADVILFESFVESPAATPYGQVERELFIPIEPA